MPVSLPADMAAARLLARLRTRRYGCSLDVRERVSSTNDEARAAAEAGAPDGHVVVADLQDAGRGAHGRRWASPAGTDLYLSIVIRPTIELAALPPLTLAVGLGVAEACDTLLSPGSAARVKWPNDVWLGGHKCAGVLVETTSSGARIDAAVVGIGLNVNRRRFEGLLAGRATSLAAEHGAPLDRAEVLAVLLERVEGWVDRFVARGPGPVVEALEPRLLFRGERVRIDGLEGRLGGILPDGALRLETASGVRSVRTGSLEPI